MSNTIAAIATPFGTGAIGVIRLSGDDSLNIANQVFSTKKLDSFCNATPNHMYFGKLDCETFCDNCLAVYFKKPHSFTGEDVVEFQCHGGIRLLEEVLKTLILKGATLASKGEFTKRAFLNGKYSLSEAEGIIDMISSENTAALNAGYRQMSGHLTKKVDNISKQILDITASLEASLDYPEELEEEVRENLPEQLENDKILEALFKQNGLNFSWHTVWNKLYKIDLWKKALKEYERIQGHLIQTEDIAFTIPIFYFAKKVVKAEHAYHFYVKNENSSTNNTTSEKIYKNFSDIINIFDFIL